MPNHVNNYAFAKPTSDLNKKVDSYNAEKLALISTIVLMKKEYSEKDLLLIEYLKHSSNNDFITYTDDEAAMLIQDAYKTIEPQELETIIQYLCENDNSNKEQFYNLITTAFKKETVSVFSNSYLFSCPINILIHYFYGDYISLEELEIPTPKEDDLNDYFISRIGNKWGIYDVEILNDSVYFLTAWEPLSDSGVVRMAEMLNKEGVELESIVFTEFGMAFCGETTITKDEKGFHSFTNFEQTDNVVWMGEEELISLSLDKDYEHIKDSHSLYFLKGTEPPEPIKKISYLM